MIETIYYTPKTNVNTKDILRSIRLEDQQWLIRVCQSVIELAEAKDIIEDYVYWLDSPNTALLRQQRLNNQFNTPRSFCLGIIDKLTASPVRRDLSPKQCVALQNLFAMLGDAFDNIPQVLFQDRTNQKINLTTSQFDQIFARR